MSLTTQEKVEKLQRVLRAKAKEAPSYRFHQLYDKVYREDVLIEAWKRCRSNGGAEGVDNQSFKDIEAYGVEPWLSELAEDLRRKTYRPAAVRRVWIPKADGKQRSSSSWNQSSTRIYSLSNTRIGPNTTLMERCMQSNVGSTKAIQKLLTRT